MIIKLLLGVYFGENMKKQSRKLKKWNNVQNIFKTHSNALKDTRNFTFYHKIFGHEYNFISKDDIGRQNLSLLQNFVSKILIECEIRLNYL